jgi:hypothetical protein
VHHLTSCWSSYLTNTSIVNETRLAFDQAAIKKYQAGT